MASSVEFLDYVLDLLSETSSVQSRKMMGEYVLYSEGRVFGGIYDDRFLIKDTESSRTLFPEASKETPYEGARQMLLVDTEDRVLIANVIAAMLPEIPAPRAKKKR